MSYRADKLGDGRTDGQTDAGNDNTRRPILASGNNSKQCKNIFVGINIKWPYLAIENVNQLI